MFGRKNYRHLIFAPLALLAACATTPKPVAYVAPMPAQPPATSSASADNSQPYIIRTSPPLQCVVYARMQSGIQIYGDANHWWAKAAGHYRRGTLPEVGGVMVLKGYGRQMDSRGHVAVIRKIADSRTMIIDHANWMGRGEISRDTPVQDVSPTNDWSQIHVWNIKAKRWGDHTYTVEGFIYPDQSRFASAR